MSFTTILSELKVGQYNYYQSYLKYLSSAETSNQLHSSYNHLVSRLGPEDHEFEKKLIALNKAHKEVLWLMMYLKQVRYCLVNPNELYNAFKATENVKPSVTQNELINSLDRYDYNKQINTMFLRTNRNTSIENSIHFYSIPKEAATYFSQKILNNIEENTSEEQNYYNLLRGHANKELNKFYKDCGGIISNYLFYVLTHKIEDNIYLLQNAIVSRDDLIELETKLKAPSTQFVNNVIKNEILQQVRNKINNLPQEKIETVEEVEVKRVKINKK